ncbi:MAG TPA: DUF3459 domain-containing protein, partial [Planosporangium sp.]|nr:DUF3459 domain-containing protein [Planosporangium sp.]
PDLSDPWLDRVRVTTGDRFLTMERGGCVVVANLAGRRQRISIPGRAGTVALATEAGVALSPDAVELPAESAVVVTLR